MVGRVAHLATGLADAETRAARNHREYAVVNKARVGRESYACKQWLHQHQIASIAIRMTVLNKPHSPNVVRDG